PSARVDEHVEALLFDQSPDGEDQWPGVAAISDTTARRTREWPRRQIEPVVDREHLAIRNLEPEHLDEAPVVFADRHDERRHSDALPELVVSSMVVPVPEQVTSVGGEAERDARQHRGKLSLACGGAREMRVQVLEVVPPSLPCQVRGDPELRPGALRVA